MKDKIKRLIEIYKCMTIEKKRLLLRNILLMLTLLGFALNIVLFSSLVAVNSNLKKLKKDTEIQASRYEDKISELENRVTLLSNQMMVEIVKNEEAEARKLPVGIPASGTATIESEPDTSILPPESISNFNKDLMNETDRMLNPYTLEISVEQGSKIIATGDGVVTMVTTDDIYGNIVKIDHENGYVSIYRYEEEPKIKQGDSVLKGQMLYEVTNEKGTFAYHILHENTYINPFDMIEISG